MQEVSTLVTVQGIEFNPSLDRVFFDFDGVLHTSTQGVRSENGFIENQAVHYAEYWKLEPNQRMIDFIADLSLNHGVACYLLTANDYRIAQLFMGQHAPQLKNAFLNMFSSLADKAEFLKTMRATHFFDDSDSVMYDIMAKCGEMSALPNLYYVDGSRFDLLEDSLALLPWDARRQKAEQSGIDQPPCAELHIVDTVLTKYAHEVSQTISKSDFTVAAPTVEHSSRPDLSKLASSLLCKGPFVGAYSFFFGTSFDGKCHHQLKWPPIYRPTACVADLIRHHLLLTVPVGKSSENFITYSGNPYAVSAAHVEAIKANPSHSLVDNDRFPMLDIEKEALVSPAVNFAEYDPIAWLRDFFEACQGCKVDAVAFHTYTCHGKYLKDHIEQYKVFGKPLWLTEFACSEAASRERLPAEGQMAFMREAIPLLEQE
ncbi:asl1, partial [Symbiodinium sp. CCMP2456]